VLTDCGQCRCCMLKNILKGIFKLKLIAVCVRTLRRESTSERVDMYRVERKSKKK
jgi:hypothetical protein